MTAPLIVTAGFGKDDHAWLEGLRRRHFPPERNQVPVHLTLFHQLAPSLESELSRRLAALTEVAPPLAQISGVMDLGRGSAFRVQSDELEAIRAELTEAFRGMLGPQDAGGWRPHITVQNKVARDTAIALQRDLGADLYPRPLHIRSLTSWRYLGGPWERVRDHPFRG